MIDAELTEDYWINAANIGDGNPDAAKGLPLPRVPDFKANLSTRYSFQIGDLDGYAQAYWVYTGSSYNSLVGSGATETRARKKQHAYDILNVAIGFEQGNWGVELFVRNIARRAGGGVQERLLLRQPHHHQQAEDHRAALAARVLGPPGGPRIAALRGLSASGRVRHCRSR